MIIRPETVEDREAIASLTTEAFGRAGEAYLIEALRARGKVVLSLVAVHEGHVAGHILFYPVLVETAGQSYQMAGLGPMAVLPQFQGQGLGSALVRRGLEELRRANHGAVVVLGHPEFYPRFGFVPASHYGIKSRYEVPDEVFMAVELIPGALAGKGGTVVYPPEFDSV
jgi:putative acetyltransferase